VIALARMKLISTVCSRLLVVALSAQMVFSQSPQQAPAAPADELHQLWSTMVEPVLRQDIKSGAQAQNVGTTMMVPLQAAFRLRETRWEHEFADHFSRLMPNFSALPEEDLGRLQYLYVASQFMVLAKQSGQQDLIPRTLPGSLMTDIWKVWTKKPAWQFEGAGKPFPGGVRERTLWKLDHPHLDKSYYREINDVDFFVFAIAGDLKAFTTDPTELKAWSPTLDDMLSIAHRVFTQEVVPQPGGGWLFQPGVWTDHPEYQYAGNNEIRPGMKPIPVPGIASDSSHFLRFPLWLRSLMQAYPPNSEDYRFYEGLRSGLEKQFFNKVLVRPSQAFPCYRMNNFMDGHNGVYRWNYPGLGPGGGFGPYGLSSSLLIGWWAFFDTDRMRDVYRDVGATFPWPKQCVEVYLGPTLPAGHPASAYDPGSSSMRLWHLSVLLDSKM
jgi:hypothetical protein